MFGKKSRKAEKEKCEAYVLPEVDDIIEVFRKAHPNGCGKDDREAYQALERELSQVIELRYRRGATNRRTMLDERMRADAFLRETSTGLGERKIDFITPDLANTLQGYENSQNDLENLRKDNPIVEKWLDRARKSGR